MEEEMGSVSSDLMNINLLTDHILARFDSLPRVEESEEIQLPSLSIIEHGWTKNNYQIKFESTTNKTLIFINDSLVGKTTEKELIITDLDQKLGNKISLVPVSNDIRGETMIITTPVLVDNLEILVPNTGFYSENML